MAVAVLGFAVSYSAPPRERDRDYELVRLMVDVLNEVDHKYVNDLDPDHKRKLVEDMINGGLQKLDQTGRITRSVFRPLEFFVYRL